MIKTKNYNEIILKLLNENIKHDRIKGNTYKIKTENLNKLSQYSFLFRFVIFNFNKNQLEFEFCISNSTITRIFKRKRCYIKESELETFITQFNVENLFEKLIKDMYL
jgi:hypothetical protein